MVSRFKFRDSKCQPYFDLFGQSSIPQINRISRISEIQQWFGNLACIW